MDPIADMLVAIKNGYMAKKDLVTIPVSKFKLQVAKVLEKEGFVASVNQEDKKLLIVLKYVNKYPAINGIKKVSKLGMRVYSKGKNIKRVKGGKGDFIVSTSNGVMTGKEAVAKSLGGEVICQIW